MSNDWLTAVWNHADVEGADLLALLALADWSDEDGVNWHRVESLARRCRRTVRATRSTLRRLEAGGFLTTESVPGRPNVYRLHLPNNGAEVLRPPQRAREEVSGTDPGSLPSSPDTLEPKGNPHAPPSVAQRGKEYGPITKESQVHRTAQDERRAARQSGKRTTKPVGGEPAPPPARPKRRSTEDMINDLLEE